VLVVDDDADTVEVLALALVSYRGWDVQAVTTGAQALEICWSSHLDVVLLDVEMPVMDGPDVLAALRADPRTALLPVVFVTALADPVVNSRLHTLGATAVLPKPFDPVRIGDQVAAFLGLPPSPVDLGPRRGQRHLESTAPAGGGFGPDATAVRLDDPAGDGQA
jgi:CheY-like chemotaxis protein